MVCISGAAQEALDEPQALGDSDDNDDKAVYSVEEGKCAEY